MLSVQKVPSDIHPKLWPEEKRDIKYQQQEMLQANNKLMQLQLISITDRPLARQSEDVANVRLTAPW